MYVQHPRECPYPRAVQGMEGASHKERWLDAIELVTRTQNASQYGVEPRYV